MIIGGMIEASSNKITVPDISPTNFKGIYQILLASPPIIILAILEYIYYDKVDLTEPLAMELIILADMYFLPNLKEDCANYLSKKLTVTNFVEVMKVSQTVESEKLEKRVVSFLISNIEKVEQVVDFRVIPQELLIKAIKDLKSSKNK